MQFIFIITLGLILKFIAQLVWKGHELNFQFLYFLSNFPFYYLLCDQITFSWRHFPIIYISMIKRYIKSSFKIFNATILDN